MGVIFSSLANTAGATLEYGEQRLAPGLNSLVICAASRHSLDTLNTSSNSPSPKKNS